MNSMSIEERLRHWAEAYDRNGYLHGSILVAMNGRILLNEGFGMANWEHRVPNRPTTAFRIGSITKSFTAMCIFQLHERGKLSIDDAIGQYIPDYPHGERITLYHCLTNSSGIPNYTSFPDFWPHTMRLPATLDQVIDSFSGLDLEFEPGSRFGYSNSGYAMLTAIIENVSGLSYADYVEEHICRPLGLRHTGCDEGTQVIPGLASGYSWWERPIHAAYADMSFPLGAYGMYSTTEDLLAWDAALSSGRLLSREWTEKMFAPLHGSYACGWMISELLGRRCVNHFGEISGYYSDLLRFPDQEAAIIVLSNMNVVPVTQVSRELAKILFGEPVSLPIPTVPVAFTEVESVAGKYAMEKEPFHVLDISVKQGELYLTVPKMYGVSYKFKLIPVHCDGNHATFVTEMIHERLLFSASPSGVIRRVEYTDCCGARHTAHRVK
ncbi:serine hydrolase domain-containing protein [Paenibacillus dendritiformis]|uniref:serine hydrolase domain-containing protein n=1 Tax=Paenibacillus dendritiformis TaxID=130049 RepID=UPI00248AB90C|nr:serine hydrolase domain-containing protein [Paenibacillus dendritiformis]WGU94186.1 serine hydrolase domain-containing protein [Paenibacillus dendritiformis]